MNVSVIQTLEEHISLFFLCIQSHRGIVILDMGLQRHLGGHHDIVPE